MAFYHTKQYNCKSPCNMIYLHLPYHNAAQAGSTILVLLQLLDNIFQDHIPLTSGYFEWPNCDPHMAYSDTWRCTTPRVAGAATVTVTLPAAPPVCRWQHHQGQQAEQAVCRRQREAVTSRTSTGEGPPSLPQRTKTPHIPPPRGNSALRVDRGSLW